MASPVRVGLPIALFVISIVVFAQSMSGILDTLHRADETALQWAQKQNPAILLREYDTAWSRCEYDLQMHCYLDHRAGPFLQRSPLRYRYPDCYTNRVLEPNCPYSVQEGELPTTGIGGTLLRVVGSALWALRLTADLGRGAIVVAVLWIVFAFLLFRKSPVAFLLFASVGGAIVTGIVWLILRVLLQPVFLAVEGILWVFLWVAGIPASLYIILERIHATHSVVGAAKEVQEATRHGLR